MLNCDNELEFAIRDKVKRILEDGYKTLNKQFRNGGCMGEEDMLTITHSMTISDLVGWLERETEYHQEVTPEWHLMIKYRVVGYMESFQDHPYPIVFYSFYVRACHHSAKTKTYLVFGSFFMFVVGVHASEIFGVEEILNLQRIENIDWKKS